ncbi:hypothetical protein LCGC14_3010000 [marine sediment metagenome]|uniref:Uncharacterized protein n=1 Tax=marine sediment metagenome TaxID=412755 RepID=A0A0F8ZPP4_9ZZZZ
MIIDTAIAIAALCGVIIVGCVLGAISGTLMSKARRRLRNIRQMQNRWDQHRKDWCFDDRHAKQIEED